MKLKHLVDILNIYLLVDYLVMQNGVRTPASIPYLDITNTMISIPASSVVRLFGFERE